METKMNIAIGLSDILLISPIIALFLFSLIPITIKVLRGNKEQLPSATIVEALIGLALTAGLLIVFGGSGKTAFNGQLVFDGLTQWMGLIAVGAAAGGLILMYENPATRGNQLSELIFLAMNSIVGMLILVSAVDLLIIFIGFCFKVSIVPFHAWTPDVYQGSPTPLSSFMATAVKTASFAAFLRVIATKPLLGSQNLFDVLQWLAVITMTVGNVAALVQSNVKRTLAYSSISHSGYLLVGLITAGVSQNSAFGAGSVG